MVVNTKHFFDHLKSDPNPLENPATQLAASALGISESTVTVIMAAYNKNGEEGLDWSKFKQRGHPASAIESGIEPLVRQEIRRANRNGEQVNIERICCFMRDELHCDAAHTTLWRTLQRWGFEFGTGMRSAQLKESEPVVIMRRPYLRRKRANRNDKGQIIRPEVYLDESYINRNHSNDNTWYFEEDEDNIIIGKPTRKGLV
jgi:transposase